MNVTVTESENLKRKLSVEVPLNEVESTYDEVYNRLQSNIKVKGFRPGKFPRGLAEKRFQDVMASEAMQNLVPKYFQKALEQLDLHPSTEPSFENLEIDKTKPFKFDVAFEVVPDFDLLPASKFKLKETKLKVPQEDIDARMKDMQKSKAALADKGDEPAGEEDVVTFDFEGKLDGEVFEGGSGQDQKLEIGSKDYLPEFHDQFKGIKAGESKTFDLTFPEDYGAAHLAGKPVQFKITSKLVEKRELPKLDKAFFSQFGELETKADFNEHISKELMNQKEHELQQDLKNQMADQIRDNYKFEVPQGIVDKMLEEFHHKLTHENPDAILDEKLFNKLTEEETEKIKGNARLSFVVEAMGKANDIKVDQEEVMQRAYMQAYMMQQDPREFLQSPIGQRVMNQVQQSLQIENTLGFLVNQVLGKPTGKPTEKAADEAKDKPKAKADKSTAEKAEAKTEDKA